MSAPREDHPATRLYAELARGLVEGPSQWQDVRGLAAAALAASGLPAGRTEAWWYTRPGAFLDGAFLPAPGAPDPAYAAAHADADAVFVDGRLIGSARAPAGVSLRSIRDSALAVHVAGFAALNLALARDGVSVHVPADRSARLVLVHVATGDRHLGASRHAFTLEPGARLELVERFVGAGPAWTSAGLSAAIGRGAELVHLREQHEGVGVLHHGVVDVAVADGGRYALVSVAGGAGTTRIEVDVRLGGDGASAELQGLTLVTGDEHVDHHVRVHHAAPRCTSRQVFRSLCDGRGRSVFTGAVHVDPGAAGTDAAQVHRALLLSEDAVANARPQLQIRCDDVKCAHGAAVGALDEESLFYLRQRGLGHQAARALLTAAFASEIVDAVPEAERDQVRARVEAWLEAP